MFFITVLVAVAPLYVLSFSSGVATGRVGNVLSMVNPKPSGFANTKEGKVVILERTKKLLDKSFLVITVPAQSITKEQVDMLKKELPPNTKASVVKNALMRKAVEGTPFAALANDLKEQNMFFFIPEGDAKPVYAGYKKWQKEVKRTDEIFACKNAAMENMLYYTKDVEAVTNLPTRLELITKIAQGIKAVPTKVAKGVKAVPDKLGRAIRAIKDKLEEEAKV